MLPLILETSFWLIKHQKRQKTQAESDPEKGQVVPGMPGVVVIWGTKRKRNTTEMVKHGIENIAANDSNRAVEQWLVGIFLGERRVED